MSMSLLGKSQSSRLPNPQVAAFRPVVTAEVWTALNGILDVPPDSPTDPVTRQAEGLRAEYRAHLDASRLTSHDHPGLEQIVQSLAAVDNAAELKVRNLRTAAGRVVLVSDGSDRPIGAVLLRKRAA